MFKYVFLTILAAISYFVFIYDTALTNELIGQLFVSGISACLGVFLLFKFGLHYKINALNRFALSFYYCVFEYKKAQKVPSGLDYGDSVREQGINFVMQAKLEEQKYTQASQYTRHKQLSDQLVSKRSIIDKNEI